MAAYEHAHGTIARLLIASRVEARVRTPFEQLAAGADRPGGRGRGGLEALSRINFEMRGHATTSYRSSR